ncbi:MAG: hypothetical protein HRU20_12890 [Pseudomonadales bacterium]|nr:hypothetical protein [Pseudomonadales bacterium]
MEAIESVIAQFEQTSGQAVEEKQQLNAAISSGLTGLDEVTGTGGFVRGRIMEISGDNMAGKTWFCLNMVKHFLDNSDVNAGAVIWANTERTLRLQQVADYGIDVNDGRFRMIQADTGETTMQIALQLVQTGQVAMLITDSLASISTNIDHQNSDFTQSNHSSYISGLLKTLTQLAAENNTLAIFTNQMRANVNNGEVNGLTTTGGNAIRHYAYLRMHLTRNFIFDKDDNYLGTNVRALFLKNKDGMPFTKFDYHIDNTKQFNEGLINHGFKRNDLVI